MATLPTSTTRKPSVVKLLEPDTGERKTSDTSNTSRRQSLVIAKEDLFTGTYEFQKYDKNLEEYLDSLGLCGRDLGRIVRQTKFKIKLECPKTPDEKWNLTTFESGKTLIIQIYGPKGPKKTQKRHQKGIKKAQK